MAVAGAPPSLAADRPDLARACLPPQQTTRTERLHSERPDARHVPARPACIAPLSSAHQRCSYSFAAAASSCAAARTPLDTLSLRGTSPSSLNHTRRHSLPFTPHFSALAQPATHRTASPQGHGDEGGSSRIKGQQQERLMASRVAQHSGGVRRRKAHTLADAAAPAIHCVASGLRLTRPHGLQAACKPPTARRHKLERDPHTTARRGSAACTGALCLWDGYSGVRQGREAAALAAACAAPTPPPPQRQPPPPAPEAAAAAAAAAMAHVQPPLVLAMALGSSGRGCCRPRRWRCLAGRPLPTR